MRTRRTRAAAVRGGLGVRVAAAAGAGRPGRFHALFGRDSLICALQVLPAAPEVARATLRALARRRAAWSTRRPTRSRARSCTSTGTVADARSPRPVARARRRAALLRHRRRDELVPVVLAALGDARLARELEPSWRAAGRLARGRARRGRRPRPPRPAPRTGGLAQQGWRDAIAPVEEHPEGAGIVRADGSEPAPPLADADSQAAAVAALGALERLDRGAGWERAAHGAARTRSARRSRPERDGARGRRHDRAGRGLAARLAAVGRRARRRGGRRGRAERLVQPDVLTPFGLRTLSSRTPRVPAARLPPRRRLAVRLLARLGRAARRRPRRRGRARPRRRLGGAGPARPSRRSSTP